MPQGSLKVRGSCALLAAVLVLRFRILHAFLRGLAPESAGHFLCLSSPYPLKLHFCFL